MIARLIFAEPALIQKDSKSGKDQKVDFGVINKLQTYLAWFVLYFYMHFALIHIDSTCVDL